MYVNIRMETLKFYQEPFYFVITHKGSLRQWLIYYLQEWGVLRELQEFLLSLLIQRKQC